MSLRVFGCVFTCSWWTHGASIPGALAYGLWQRRVFPSRPWQQVLLSQTSGLLPRPLFVTSSPSWLVWLVRGLISLVRNLREVSVFPVRMDRYTL